MWGRALDFAHDLDWQDFYDRAIGLRVRTAPFSGAHVASALNEALPGDRRTWTPQSLFVFISAFAKAERHRSAAIVEVSWLRSPDIVVKLLLRGTNVPEGQLKRITAMLLDECNEVLETLPLMAPHERDAIDDGFAPTTDQRGLECGAEVTESRSLRTAATQLWRVVGEISSAITATPGRAKATISQRRRRLKDQRIVERLAAVLLDGGLSTRECRELLVEQGIAPTDIDEVLRRPQRNIP